MKEYTFIFYRDSTLNHIELIRVVTKTFTSPTAEEAYHLAERFMKLNGCQHLLKISTKKIIS